ncbi:hypothetical protein Patl1_24041 [Pistacia atlantica]|uniref:Uncharacterized protein n=1 Tax=Pistacia atlantica TaxID=434234 RepID=A0ACC0ZYW8_9ROSI|nr:hypothetical protein Patl1_24041 [Pistacia atlantica]
MQSTESSYVSSLEELVRKRTPPPPKSVSSGSLLFPLFILPRVW